MKAKQKAFDWTKVLGLLKIYYGVDQMFDVYLKHGMALIQ